MKRLGFLSGGNKHEKDLEEAQKAIREARLEASRWKRQNVMLLRAKLIKRGVEKLNGS